MSDRTAFEVGRLYQPIKAIADVITGSQKDVFIRLPALVAYYPMGIRLGGNVVEHGGSGLVLTQTGVNPVGYDGNAYTHLGNGTNYVQSTSSQFGITGLETWVTSSLRGLTVGGWFMVDVSPASVPAGMTSKDGGAADRGYLLGWRQTDVPYFQVSGNGVATFSADGPVTSVSEWHFVVGRYKSSEIAVFVDGEKSVTTAGVPASLFVSSQNFEVGRYFNDNGRILYGKVRDAFVCAAALSDELIEQIRATSVP